ncbi:MAG: bifunctional adenosylcobinamide kinase/adenosylcobinamide-phosphate guanylyltransferase, partial [Desulfovibrionaceae bacterium]
WLFSCIEEKLQDERTATLLATLSKWSGPELFLVSCEIGLGPLPASGATRRFTRALGGLNQEVAVLADKVFLVAAGLPLELK